MVWANRRSCGDDRLRVQLGAPVGREARVDHRRRRDVDEVAHARGRGRGDHVGGAVAVDRVVVAGIARQDDRGEVEDGVGARDRGAERWPRRGCPPPTISQPVPVEPRAQRIVREHQPPHPPAVGRQPPHEPPSHLAGGACHQHRASQRAGPPGRERRPVDRLEVAHGELARGQLPDRPRVLPARRSSPPASASSSIRRVACAPASFCAITSTSRPSARASCGAEPRARPPAHRLEAEHVGEAVAEQQHRSTVARLERRARRILNFVNGLRLRGEQRLSLGQT